MKITIWTEDCDSVNYKSHVAIVDRMNNILMQINTVRPLLSTDLDYARFFIILFK